VSESERIRSWHEPREFGSLKITKSPVRPTESEGPVQKRARAQPSMSAKPRWLQRPRNSSRRYSKTSNNVYGPGSGRQLGLEILQVQNAVPVHAVTPGPRPQEHGCHHADLIQVRHNGPRNRLERRATRARAFIQSRMFEAESVSRRLGANERGCTCTSVGPSIPNGIGRLLGGQSLRQRSGLLQTSKRSKKSD